jgi:hypothetical protein
MQWRIPAFVSLDRAAGFPMIFPNIQKPFARYAFSESPFFTKLKSRVLQSTISDARHPV